MSDLSEINKWWRTLGNDGFVALEPPTRGGRYTQTDGHDDFAELVEQQGISKTASFAYWHLQSHDRAFDRSGQLRGPLLLHWGHDYEVVRAGLGAGPDGYEVVDHGPQGAFALDKVTARGADGMPDPADASAVRQFLEELNVPVRQDRIPYEYRPLTEQQQTWLHDRLAECADVDAAMAYLRTLEYRQLLTAQEAQRFGDDWRTRYEGRLVKLPAMRELLHAMMRHDLPMGWELARELGDSSLSVIGRIPTAKAEDVLRQAVLEQRPEAVEPWLRLAKAQVGGVIAAAVRVSQVLLATGAVSPAMWAELARWLTNMRADEAPARDHAINQLVRLELSVDDQLPRPLRQAIAADAVEYGSDMDARVLALDPQTLVGQIRVAGDTARTLERFQQEMPSLLDGTGPVLTQYEGGLTQTWGRYRTLSLDDIQWLRDRVADPTTEMQGLGYCMELLYAHGEAGTDEVDALASRWRKVIAKQYKTTYTEWRHPMVTLTCLAQDIGHPLAQQLLAWWQKPAAKWKTELAPLTLLGAPTPQKADELWKVMQSGVHDSGHLMTWVLMRARLDHVHPLAVADHLMNLDPQPFRPYVLHRVVISVADPAQPLWHYNIGHSPSWWSRIVEVADNAALSQRTRQMALEEARGHRMVNYPEHVYPRPSAPEVADARAWLAARSSG
ncbi:hypothetical protein [Yimella sp. cx-51]|uniref:hypothetical protein n=1 Tax=Yimella sp. cx-51 TaxID=2770551 RepID=UPI00165E4A4E|nr:hypothetical protein [Yimella sp. cx-51]MBC9955455.1 hypothetical protein [Yimella sp. cx-51]QTH37955.1 hypothetical protein J5M86_14135 [Yimella sp. cx-51]